MFDGDRTQTDAPQRDLRYDSFELSTLTPHIGAEIRGLLDMLYRHIGSTPRLYCRIEWQPNTLAFWDNRCTQHHAVWDYYPHSRYGERVSIVGDQRPSA